MANLPRIRSAKEAASELRKLDPGTKFCEHHIRYLMRSGAVPMITAGCRQFVNLDTLIEYLKANEILHAFILIKGSRGNKLERITEYL